MKKLGILLTVVILAITGMNVYGQTAPDQKGSFNDIFTQIDAKEIPESVFKLVGSDYSVITAGDPSLYNSMVASWGGGGILFEKPTTWCFLRSNRYTLEIIRKKETYTMSYFDDEYKKDFLLFGKKSGRNSDKMKESKLSVIQPPSGNLSYKEAKLIIECKLAEVTTVAPGDFYTEQGKKFVEDAHAETNDYHKIVFGEITNVWIRK